MSTPNSLVDLLNRWRDSDHPYVVAPDGAALTYANAVRCAASNAAALRRLGVAGRHVGLAASLSADAIVAYWSLLAAGNVVVLLAEDATLPELDAVLARADSCWLAADPQTAQRLAGFGGLPCGLLSISATGVEALRNAPSNPAPAAVPGDLAVLAPTSGSTAMPKLVTWSHANLIANCTAQAEALALDGSDRALMLLAFNYSYSHTAQLLCHTRLGGTLLLGAARVFMPRRFCQLAETMGATVASLAPPMLSMLSRFDGIRGHDLSRLRLLCFGGGPAEPGAPERLQSLLPDCRLVQTYGLTEASPRVASLVSRPDLQKWTSVGLPLPGVEVAIFTAQGKTAPPDVLGEVCVRGPNVTAGYYREPLLSRKLLRDGWLHTGDLGFQDPEGYLFLRGRIDNLIVSGGVNIAPEEIESVLLQHPLVQDVRVVAEPDPVLGEIAVAEIVAREAMPTLQQLHDQLEGKVRRAKWPRKLYSRAQIARTLSGKIQRCSTRSA